MKDFTLLELSDETALNFPGIPQHVVRQICKSVLFGVVDIVQKKKGRIRMQHADIHTVYFDVVPSEQRAKFADLDESRMLTEEEEQQSIITRISAKSNLPRTIKRLNSRYKGVHYQRFTADTLYPPAHEKGSSRPIQES